LEGPKRSPTGLPTCPVKKEWVLTQEAFDALLAWLDPNRDAAAQKYESIRTRLIKIFSCRGCLEAEDLADETINRVTSKLADIQASFTGDPARYFYAVAKKILLEYSRRRPAPSLPEPTIDFEEFDAESEYECLDRCIGKLTPENRDLVLSYYQEEKHAKIAHRKQLAASLGIAVNALRIRAHRIRTELEQCVKQCLQETAA
jgi:RNA polymerase sigma factor (sigma-70 family)